MKAVRFLWPFALPAALLAASFPPFDVFPLAWAGAALLAWACVRGEGGPPRRRFFGGWAAGTLFYALTMYWVAGVMRHYGGLSLWWSVPIALLLAAYLGLYVAAFSWLTAASVRRWGGGALWFAPCWWVFLEWLRNYALSGLPWNPLGLSQHRWLPMIQPAALGGVYAVSFVVMWAAAGAVHGALRWRSSKPAAVFSMLAALALPGAAFVYGKNRLASEPRDAAPLRVALVQGNVPQDAKLARMDPEELVLRHIRLSMQAAESGPQHVVWPESAIPLVYSRSDFYRRSIGEAVRAMNAYLTLGTPRFVGSTLRNSAITVSPEGEVVMRYDKMHLVPFGEYVPLSGLLFFAKPLVREVGDFRPGTQMEVVQTAGGRAYGMAICFEIIFPEHSREAVRRGASYLVTITNDAWFGRSAAPWQHFAHAALRAVETRRYVARAANTGVSGIVDWHGRVLQQSPLFEEAVLTGVIQTTGEVTPYVRWGDILPKGCGLLTGFFLTQAALGSLWLWYRKKYPPAEEAEAEEGGGEEFPEDEGEGMPEEYGGEGEEEKDGA